MSSGKTGGRRNYSYGRSMCYAIRRALVDRYGQGRFSNRYTLLARLGVFRDFLISRGVRDLNDVGRSTLLEYSVYLRQRVAEGSLAISTAVNYLSATNCLMIALRSDKKVWVSPRQELGARTYVRQVVPEGLDATAVVSAATYMNSVGEERVGGVLLLARFMGLRFKEASLLDFRTCLKEVRGSATSTISKGTKGGRTRIVSVSKDAEASLAELTNMFPVAKNLIPEEWSYIQWSRYCYRIWSAQKDRCGIRSKISDLRAAFACCLYEEITGAKAPVITGGRTVARYLDERAREAIATQLGHSRTQIAASYVGTSVRARS